MSHNKPNFEAGIQYWGNTEASVNGVLGGYGPLTAVPRLDAASTRLLILSLLPTLSNIIPPHRPKHANEGQKLRKRSFRALDCGAGIGRVTSSVLLPLFCRIDIVEPVRKFLDQAVSNAKSGREGWKMLMDPDCDKGVRMWQAGLQFFDPASPAVPIDVGTTASTSELVVTLQGDDQIVWPDPFQRHPEEDGYDVIMVQWCVGHLSNEELTLFLRRSKEALRETTTNGVEGYIIVKENTCKSEDGNGSGMLWDEDDSSFTRSDQVFRKIFANADLCIIKSEVQQGFPKELFPVISYVLQ